MKGILIMMLALLLCGCRVGKEASKWEREYYNQTQITDKLEQEKDSLSHVIRELTQQRNDHEEKDSSYHSKYESDTLIVKDSVHTKELADGSKETTYWHEETRLRTVRDTVIDRRHERELRELISVLQDSLAQVHEEKDTTSFVQQTDSVSQAAEKEVITVTEPWWKSLPRTLGWIVIIAGLVVIAWKILKTRFNLF